MSKSDAPEQHLVNPADVYVKGVEIAAMHEEPRDRDTLAAFLAALLTLPVKSVALDVLNTRAALANVQQQTAKALDAVENEVAGLEWVTKTMEGGHVSHRKALSHGVKDDKGREVGSVAVIWEAKSCKLERRLWPTRDGELHGSSPSAISGGSLEDAKRKADRQLVKARAQAVAKWGAK